MTEQESRDWDEFASRVTDLRFDKGDEWSLYDCFSTLRACVGRAASDYNPDEMKQHELIKIAYFAQLAYTKLKNHSFDQATAIRHLKAGNPVRPAHTPNLIALSYLHGSDLTRYAGVNCGEGRLFIPEQIVSAAEDLGVFFTGMLPSSSNEWVLTTQEEIDAVKDWGKSAREKDE